MEKVKSHTNFSSNSNLFVYNFSPTFSDSDLLKMFSPFGTVVSAKVRFEENIEIRLFEIEPLELVRDMDL